MKSYFKKAWKGFVAAVTSPTAVKQEKSAAVFITTRIVLSLGASAGVVAGVEGVFRIFGWA